MSDAVARAREIAARLAGLSAGNAGGSELGKRGRDEPAGSTPRPSQPSRGLYGDAAPPPPSSSIYGASNEVKIDIYIDNKHAGALIGRGGENLALLQRETGAHLDIQQQSAMKPGDDRRLVTVKGEESCANALKLRIEQFMRDREAPAPAPTASTHAFTENFEVPDARVGTIIGRGGMKMREIMENTRTSLKIPTAHDVGNPAVRTIQISADVEDDILACKAEILTLLDATAQQSAQGGVVSSAPTTVAGGYSSAIVVPDDKVGTVIGKAGCVVKDIQSRLGVRLQIPTAADVGTNPPVRTITVSGPAYSVEAAKMEINEKVTYNPQMRQQQQGGPGAGPPGGGAGMYGPGSHGASASAVQQQEDPTYYADYWNYASHYGERAARTYYSTWAPPVGTRPPPGVTVAKDMTAEELAAAASGNTTGSGSAAGATDTSKAEPSEQDTKTAEWDTYVKGYREWWVAHGKATGAPEEPPAQ